MNINIQAQYGIGERVFVEYHGGVNIGVVTGISYYMHGNQLLSGNQFMRSDN